jgi:hypothetical protein
MCYTNKVFQFKVVGPAWEVVNAGQKVTHQVTEVHQRWARVEQLPEPIEIQLDPKVYTVIAGHTCPSEWGGWDGRSGFLSLYQGLHSGGELGFIGESTWKQDDEYRSSPFEHPDLIEDYATPYPEYQAGMCDLAVKLIQVTGVNPGHLMFWTGYGREWGPALTKRKDEDEWDTYWYGFAAAREVDPDPWTVWYDLRQPEAFYPNLVHLNHCEAPLAAVKGLAFTHDEVSSAVIERGLEYHFGSSKEYLDWQKKVWGSAWPPTFWVANAVAQLQHVLEANQTLPAWHDNRYLVVDDFEVTALVSHPPALALLHLLKEIDCLEWDEMLSLETNSETKEE